MQHFLSWWSRNSLTKMSCLFFGSSLTLYIGGKPRATLDSSNPKVFCITTADQTTPVRVCYRRYPFISFSGLGWAPSFVQKDICLVVLFRVLQFLHLRELYVVKYFLQLKAKWVRSMTRVFTTHQITNECLIICLRYCHCFSLIR